MKFAELDEQQKHQLREGILCERIRNVSCGELINAEEYISDDELEKEFGATEFVEEDFF